MEARNGQEPRAGSFLPTAERFSSIAIDDRERKGPKAIRGNRVENRRSYEVVR